MSGIDQPERASQTLIRDLRAMYLFDKEHISLSLAARLARRSVSEMIDLLGRHGISVIRTTPEELERELADFG